MNSPDLNSFYPIIADESIIGTLAFHKANKVCIYANRIAREILELSPTQQPSEISLDSMKPQRIREGFRGFSDELLQLEGLIRDVMMQKSDGTLFVADLGIKNVNVEGDDFILLMFEDVTVQKKLQREVQMKQQELHQAFTEVVEQNKQLKELDIAKDRFIALTTHELRTPISAIYATAEVLKNKFYDTDEQREDFIGTIFEQAAHFLELVNDILDFAKIQAGKMDFFIQEMDLRESLDLIVTNLDPMAKQKGLELIYEAPEPPVLCYYDSVRLGEVFSNVINNAIKFTEKGQVKIKVSDLGDKLQVAVEDTGAGIPEDKVDKVFNEFETVGSIKTHQKGTGLGMPISKRIMETLGGKIYLKSTVGVGTTFFIEIPKERILDEDSYRARPESAFDLLDTV